jgi:Zn-dependent protease
MIDRTARDNPRGCDGVDMTQTPAAPAAPFCQQCGQPLAPGQLACPACAALAYRPWLEQLAADATRLEQVGDYAGAALRWRQCLDLLPPDSGQYQAIYARLGALAGAAYGYAPAPPPYGTAGYAPPSPAAPNSQRARPQDPWPVALTKTVGSMAINILVYWFLFYASFRDARFAFGFAFGFAVLILVHEMGHVFAIWHYRLSASPPIFIPFVGALINLRERPANAKVEAVIGIGGPVLGTVGTLVCFALYALAPVSGDAKTLLLWLCAVGCFLNLFNLLPLPPLDGGRVMAAVSPWTWLVGLAALVGLIGWDYYRDRRPSFILLLILFFSLPRVIATLRHGRRGDYYKVSRRAATTIGLLYLTVTLVLGGMLVHLYPDLPAFLKPNFSR